MTNCISCSVVAYNIALKKQKRAQYPCNDIPRKKREYKFTKGAASSLWLLDINTQQRKNNLTNAVFMGVIVLLTQLNRIHRISAVCYVKTFFCTVKHSESITALMTVRTFP
jgi:ribosomal protein L20